MDNIKREPGLAQTTKEAETVKREPGLAQTTKEAETVKREPGLAQATKEAETINREAGLAQATKEAETVKREPGLAQTIKEAKERAWSPNVWTKKDPGLGSSNGGVAALNLAHGQKRKAEDEASAPTGGMSRSISGDAGGQAYRTSTPASASSSRSRHPSMTLEMLDVSDVSDVSHVTDVDLNVLAPYLQPTLGMDQLDESDGGEVDAATAAGIQELRGYMHGLDKYFVFDRLIKTEKGNANDGRTIHTGRAKCKQTICKGKAITFTNKTRANLKKHYEKVHKDLTRNLAAAFAGVSKRGRDKSKDDYGFSAKKARQLCMEESFANKDKFRPEVARKMWNRWFVETMMPLSITDHHTTKELMAYLCPGFAVPSRTTLVRDIHQSYTAIRTDLSNLLFKIKYVATTADSWTAHNRAFLGMTVHWIDEATLSRKKATLGCKEIKESQTKVLLAQVISDVHQDFGLGHKVVATTTDNGANYVAAFKHFGVEDVPVEGRQEEEDLEEVVIGRPSDVHDLLEDQAEETLFELPKHHRCAAHTINLMATADIEKVKGWNSGLRPPFRKAAAKAQSAWNLQNRSSVVANNIKAVFGKKMKTFCVTRWNSYYDSVKSLMEVLNNPTTLPAFNDILAKNKVATFDDMDKKILSEYLKVMEPVALCLDKVQSETDAYMGTLIPHLSIMRAQLQRIKNESTLQYAQPLVEALLGEGPAHSGGFNARFGHFFRNGDILMATALHPNYCLPGLKKCVPEMLPVIKARIIMEVKSAIRLDQQETVQQMQEDDADDDLLDKVLGSDDPEEREERQQEQLEEGIAKVLDGWKRAKMGTPLSPDRFPIVYREVFGKLFLKYNTPLPSSAAVERLFSSAGDILRPKRSSLTNLNFEQLVFMRGNMQLLGYKELNKDNSKTEKHQEEGQEEDEDIE